MKYIVIIIILNFSGELEYRKYEFINNSKTNEELVLKCSDKADEIREQISYHTWNYKNKGPMSQGWYLKDDTGMLVGSIC